LTTGATQATAKSKRELAAERYRYAQTLLGDLEAVPALELGEKQYRLVAKAFRNVHRADPRSGYCDDALFHAAAVTAKMSDRFDSDRFRGEAEKAYRFLIAQYPHSKLNAQARVALARLEAGESVAPAEPPPAVKTVEEAEPLELSRAEQPVTPSTPTAIPVGAQAAAPRENRIELAPPPKKKGVVRVREMRQFSQPDLTRVIIQLDDFVQFKHDELPKPHRLYFDLFSSRLSGKLIRGASHNLTGSVASRVRIAQNRRSTARIVFDLTDKAHYNVSWLSNPPRMVIELAPASGPVPSQTLARAETPATSASTPAALEPPMETAAAASASEPLAPPRPADATARGNRTLIRALGLKTGRVVIDAGHGGHDTGTIGKGGLREKDIVLDIGLQLGKLLEDRLGIEVLYTRDDDSFIDLNDRPRIANRLEADLFISIHANSSRSRKARGIETFYLNVTNDAWALQVASRENAAANRSIHELQDLLSTIVRNDKIDESREFATRVQRSLYSGAAKSSGGIRDRGVKKAPMLVLLGAKMPAVLAEIGFISNSQTEKQLKTSKYRRQVAAYLFNGVADYVSSLGANELTKSDTNAAAASLD